MVWTIFKDFGRFLLILLLGFLSGFSINIQEDIFDLDMELEEINSRIQREEPFDLNDYEGKINIAFIDKWKDNLVTVSFPFSYIKSIFQWSKFHISDNDVKIGIVFDEFEFHVADEDIDIEKLRRLKPGEKLQVCGDEDNEIVIFWRSRK